MCAMPIKNKSLAQKRLLVANMFQLQSFLVCAREAHYGVVFTTRAHLNSFYMFCPLGLIK
jgi:hypothetical protein